jgi:N-acetylmuramoyl-L-alanine amidase
VLTSDLQEYEVAAAETTPIAETSTPSASGSIVDFCHANPQARGDEWAARMDDHAFPSDLSAAAQKQLPEGVVVHPTCNFAMGNLPHAIVLHYTDGGSLDGVISTFRAAYGTSAHYIIDRNGAVVQMVPENLAAFHVSCTGNRSNCVPSCPICDSIDGRLVEPYTQSIGIELVNDGKVDPNVFKGPIYEDYLMAFGYRYWEDYTQAQIDALRVLVMDIRARYNIPWDMVLGHYRINAKADPGPALNLFWPRYGYPPQPPIFDTSQP